MTLVRFTCIAAVVVLAACKQPLEIRGGEGDITSLSGTRDCSLEDYLADFPNCADNLVENTAYNEVYTAVPRPGFHFRRWGNYCKAAIDNQCGFSFGIDVVEAAEGYVFPPLQAVFRPNVNTGFTSLFIGNDFSNPFGAGLGGHAATEGFPDHVTTSIVAAGDAGAPEALWNDPVERAAIQAVLNAGDVELLGMTHSAAYPTLTGYEKWVKYALQRNPDTRFFISVPWSDDPAGLSAAQFEAQYEAAEAAVHVLIDELRAKFPGVDFYCVPAGRAAAELYNLYDAANLPDVSALVGSPATALFGDAQGSPGNILTAAGELVWFAAIYDIDLAAYGFDPGYITDVKALAGAVIDAHDGDYNAPDEVDVDSDGDGIVDRHDANPLNRPNILLIMVDDLGFNDLAINNGNTGIDTPNMDSIAQQGVRFTRHYASPVCSPARAALLTGMVPERLGFFANGRGISPEITTLGERLQQEDYTTWHIGKWHIGERERLSWPDHQGFDHWFGFLSQAYLAGSMVGGELVPATPRYENPWLQGDAEPGAYYPGHLEEILTDKAVDVIADLHAEGAPWFLNLWYYAPHSPISPAPEFAALYPDTDEGRYRALVNQLDSNIGELYTLLQGLDALDDTIVVIVSDNGGTNAALDNNAPYFGNKNTLWEGGLRTPLIIRWTDPAVNGQVFADTITIHDLYPTLLAAAGLSVPGGLDGVDYYPSIAAGLPAPQRELYWDHGIASRGILDATGRYRYFQSYPIYGVVPDPVLLDLVLDPTGTQKVIPIPPAIADPMLANYAAWFRDVHTVDTLFTPDAYGGGVLTGMDFLRTPGYTHYTFGLGIPTGYSGPLVDQAGAWSMNRSGNTITLQAGPVILSGDISAGGSCHEIVLTGNFGIKGQAFSPPDFIDLALYIDGVEVDSININGALDVADVTAPTIIGDPFATAPTGTIGPPVVLNTMLTADTPWTVGEFSDTLCPAP